MNAIEIWKPIPGYKNHEASSLGRLRSLDKVETVKNRHGTVTKRLKKGRILSVKKSLNNSGYIFRKLISKGPTESDHRLIAMAFHGVPKVKMIINHKNGIKTDNRPENLEWTTYKKNALHSRLHLGKKGKKNTYKIVIKVLKDVHSGMMVKDAAKKNNLERHTVSRILRNRMWRSEDYPELKKAREAYPYVSKHY